MLKDHPSLIVLIWVVVLFLLLTLDHIVSAVWP